MDLEDALELIEDLKERIEEASSKMEKYTQGSSEWLDRIEETVLEWQDENDSPDNITEKQEEVLEGIKQKLNDWDL